jgi:hypothetical protein
VLPNAAHDLQIDRLGCGQSTEDINIECSSQCEASFSLTISCLNENKADYCCKASQFCTGQQDVSSLDFSLAVSSGVPVIVMDIACVLDMAKIV